MIRKDVGESKEFDAGYRNNNFTDINQAIDFFNKAKEGGATHIAWYAQADTDYESQYCNAQPFYEAMETDEEFQKRVNAENERIKTVQLYTEYNEVRLLKKLKAKYPNI